MLFERLCAAADVHQLSGNGGVPYLRACPNVTLSKMPVHSCLIGQVRRRKWSRPLGPTMFKLTCEPFASHCRANSELFRTILRLNPPHSPRSLVMTSTSTFFPPHFCSRGCENRFTLWLRLLTTPRIWGGRRGTPRKRSCDRFSLAAATIFMALVIFCLF